MRQIKEGDRRQTEKESGTDGETQTYTEERGGSLTELTK